MKKENWIWMPHPGHFICAHYCRFTLNTYVGGYIVSTVGEYVPSEGIMKIYAQSRGVEIIGRGDDYERDYLKKIGFEEIGAGRKYETMVFRAVKAPAGDDEACCPWRTKDGRELDMRGYNSPKEAYLGHLALCEEWSNK